MKYFIKQAVTVKINRDQKKRKRLTAQIVSGVTMGLAVPISGHLGQGLVTAVALVGKPETILGEKGRGLSTESKKVLHSIKKRYKINPTIYTKQLKTSGPFYVHEDFSEEEKQFLKSFGKKRKWLPKIPRLAALADIKSGIHLVGYGKEPDALAHELGHAVSLKRFGNVKSLFKFGPLGGGAIAGVLLADPEKRKYAPAAAAVGFAPILYGEGKASLIGTRAIKKALGTRAAWKSGKRLLGTFGLYGIAPLSAAGLVSLIAKKKNQ